MTSNKAFEFLYGFYLYMHHHNVTLHEMYDFMKEEWEKIGKDLEILEILKPFVKAVIELKGQNINVLDFNISDSAKTKIKGWLDA